MSNPLVLDAFAVLAFMKKEAGYRAIKRLFDEAALGQIELFLTEINWGEVYYAITKERGEMAGKKALIAMDFLPLHYVPTNRELVLAAARIKARYPVSYADAFAIAAAQEFNCPVVTGDPEFRRVEQAGMVKLLWVGA